MSRSGRNPLECGNPKGASLPGGMAVLVRTAELAFDAISAPVVERPQSTDNSDQGSQPDDY